MWTTFYSTNSFSLLKEHVYFLLDIRNRSDVRRLFSDLKPDIVIHTASIGSVDYAETNRKVAWKTNVMGTDNVIWACEEIGAKIIFISSNAVFDGEDAPYSESDPVNPINYYGKLKIEGEMLVKNSKVINVIIRPILMYGWNSPNRRQNPVTWLLSMLEKKQSVNVVTDIHYNPLLVDDCARAIWSAVELGKTGTFHVGGEDRISLFNFAREVASIFELDISLIKPVKNEFFKNIAPRPKDTCYVTKKMQEELKVYPKGVKDGLLFMRGQR